VKFPLARSAIVPDFWTVLDVDDLTWLSEFGHLVPLTYRYRTARGFHFYYQKVPHLKSSVGKIANKVDILTGIKPVLFWPHINGLRPIEAIIPPFPKGLLDLATRNPSSAAFSLAGGEVAGSSPASSPGVMAAGLPVSSSGGDGPLLMVRPGEVPKALYFKVLSLVPLSNTAKNLKILKTPVPGPPQRVTGRHQRYILSILRTLIEKHENRNKALNDAAYIFRPLIAAGVLTYPAAASLLFDAAMLNGYVAKDGRSAAIATIHSGLGLSIRSEPPPYIDDGAEA
jgi:hypothetical protein